MKAEIQIRRAKADDFEGVFSLFKQLGELHQSESFYAERKSEFKSHIEHLIVDPNIFFMVASSDKSVLGFLMGMQAQKWWDYQKKAFSIEALVVDHNARNRGVASLLLIDFEERIKANKGEKILVNSNFSRTEAHQFYEKKGFKKTAYLFVKPSI